MMSSDLLHDCLLGMHVELSETSLSFLVVFIHRMYSLYISRRTRLFDFVVTPSTRRITVYMTVVVRQLSGIHHPRDENKM